jgi:hypothetical protein
MGAGTGFPLPVALFSACGERERGSNKHRCERLPLTPTLSPLKGGERGQYARPLTP